MANYLAVIVVGLATLLLFYLYNILWRTPEKLRRALRKQGITGPPPSFVLGPTFMFSAGNVVFLCISDPKTMKALSTSTTLVIGRVTSLAKQFAPILGNGIITSNGHSWARQRKIIAPGFFKDNIKGMIDSMVISTLQLLESWETQLDCAGCVVGISMDTELRRFGEDVLSRACFGSDYTRGAQIFSKVASIQGTVSLHKVLSSLPGLTQVNQKALRLFPPAPLLLRQVHQDVEIGGLHLPKGTCLWIPAIQLNYDTTLWGTDADQFNPERFSNGVAGAGKHPHMYIPFGMGIPTCLGQNFAMTELKIVLSMMLARFKVSPSPNYRHSVSHGLALKPKYGVQIMVERV